MIYLNSFTKSIAPAIRISYLVLPPELMGQFRRRLGFYACTVPSFEQYTLARFLSRGYFEKHINRMKKYYRGQRDRLIAALSQASFSRQVEILEQDAGLHFLLRVRTRLPDRDLKALCAQAGIRILCFGPTTASGKTRRIPIAWWSITPALTGIGRQSCWPGWRPFWQTGHRRNQRRNRHRGRPQCGAVRAQVKF